MQEKDCRLFLETLLSQEYVQLNLEQAEQFNKILRWPPFSKHNE
jgi:hypothetical protein